jgi:hypothetical protein
MAVSQAIRLTRLVAVAATSFHLLPRALSFSLSLSHSAFITMQAETERGKEASHAMRPASQAPKQAVEGRLHAMCPASQAPRQAVAAAATRLTESLDSSGMPQMCLTPCRGEQNK